MKFKTKLMCILLVFAVILSMAACDCSPAPTDAPAEGSSTAPTDEADTISVVEPATDPTVEPSTVPATEPVTEPTEAPTTEPAVEYAGKAFLRVNPEIAVYFDADGKVYLVEALNQDAAALLADFRDYEGIDFAIVAANLVELVGKAGYFDQEEATVAVTLDSVDGNPLEDALADRLKAEVTKSVGDTLTEGNWDADLTVERLDKPEVPTEPATEPTTEPETEPVTEPATEPTHQHSYEAIGTYAPDCANDGYTLYECVCGDYYYGDYVDALGHSYESKTVPATDTEQGYTEHTCVRCWFSYRDNYTAVEVVFIDVDEIVASYDGFWLYEEPNLQSSHSLGTILWRKDMLFHRIGVSNNGWSCLYYFGEVRYTPSDNLYKVDTSGFKTKFGYDTTTGRTVEEEIVLWHNFAVDPKAGIAWDGVSPLIFIYPDGTVGTELVDGAQYEYAPGSLTTYVIDRDDAGRPIGSTCPDCGRTVGHITQGVNCTKSPWQWYCTECGNDIEADTCHTCEDYVDGVFYCIVCRKQMGDGSNGTCVRYYQNITCEHCGEIAYASECHTCGVSRPSLPGTPIDSLEQLTEAHRAYLCQFSRDVVQGIAEMYVEEMQETYVSTYALVLSDGVIHRSQSKCIAFFIFTTVRPFSEKPVYHIGEFFDLSILEDGTLDCKCDFDIVYHTYSEEDWVEEYAGYGYEITKIS